jgi:4-amino-4-deoxy-L-arabinose transferase-like glycosyltransferase
MKGNFKKHIFILAVIVLIAAFLRFYQLGSNPPSLTWDEVAWGYNAYSLGIDGKDEFGRFLPFNYLESFGDFKPPMYAYLSVLPVKIFGLTEFATRFVSALFGSLTVLMTYFLVVQIFRRTNQNSTQNHAEAVALIAAAILAISPWHIMLSRAAFEANVATFFLISGVFLFLRGIRKNPWLLSFSAVSFIASMYTFNTSRIVAPLLVIMLVIGFWKKLLIYKKQTIVAIILGLAVLLPIVPFLLSPQAALRFKEVNIFSDSKVVELANQEIANDNYAIWSRIVHNRRVGYTLSYIQHYFDNLSPDFLFIKGDGNPKFSIQSVGQMYIWELPFLILGVILLFRKRDGIWWIVPLWLVLAIIPAATARETPHALRIETTLPTFQILVAYGIVQAYLLVVKSSSFAKGFGGTQSSHKVIKRFFVACFVLVVSFGLVYFLHGYYGHYARETSGEWQYGYKEAVSYINEVEDKYSAIYFTESLGRPYAYLLFYKENDPTVFRRTGRIEREALGFVNVLGYDKFYFGKARDSVIYKGNVLYIDTPKDVPGNAQVKKKFYLLNGEVSLVAYTLN